MNKLRSLLNWILIIGVTVFGGYLINSIFFNPIESIYNVTARTEFVEFTTLDNNLSRYNVYGATIFNDENLIEEHFDGSIQIKENTEVKISRLDKGDISITLENNSGKNAAIFYNGYDMKVSPIEGNLLYIYVDSIESKLKKQLHHHFNIEGETKIGKNIYHLNFFESPAMLYSGNVSILGRSFWGGDYFEAGTRKLHTGDRVVFDLDKKNNSDQDSLNAKGVGFVRIDSNEGMNLVYRRKAQDVLIYKPGPKSESSSYSISVSLVERFINDKLFWGLSIFLGFCFLLINLMTFVYDTHSFLNSNNDQNSDKKQTPYDVYKKHKREYYKK